MKRLNHHTPEESTIKNYHQEQPCYSEKLLSENLIVIIQKMFYQKGTTS